MSFRHYPPSLLGRFEMIRVSLNKTSILFITIAMSMLLHTTLATAAEQNRLWSELTPLQKQALIPLATQWDSLPLKLKGHLIHASNQYPSLSLEQKKRFQSRLEKWSKLTPEQREKARNKFKAVSNEPAEKRELLRRTVPEHKNSDLAESSVLPDVSVH